MTEPLTLTVVVEPYKDEEHLVLTALSRLLNDLLPVSGFKDRERRIRILEYMLKREREDDLFGLIELRPEEESK